MDWLTPARRGWRRTVCALALALPLALANAQAYAQAAGPTLRPGPGLKPDGMPPIPVLPQDALAADEPVAPRFVAWHPQRAEMLVLQRRGRTNQLHRLTAPGGKPEGLTSGDDAVEGARYEPQAGEYLVFRRDQGGDEAWRLYRLPAEGGREQVISPQGVRASDYQFLPRGGGLLYLAERLDRALGAGEEKVSQSRLVWVDPQQPEQSRVLAQEDGARYTGLVVGPDGSFMVSVTRERRTERLRWAALDAQPVTVRTTTDMRPGRDEAVVWGTAALRSEFRHLVKTGLRSGAREGLLTSAPHDLEAVAAPAPESGAPLALSYNEAGFSRLYTWDPAQAETAPQPYAGELSPGVVRSLRWHPRLPLLAIEQVSAQSPGRILVWNAQAQQQQAWSGGERQRNALEYQALRWNSFDGLGITGLHLAPGPQHSGRRPVVISLHGGPASQARPAYVGALHRRLVEELGVHVIYPNVRGSEGYGRAFLAADDGKKREDAVKDVSALLDVLARRDDVDPARILVEGGSYGGYLSLAVSVRESARIAGSICRVGIANFVSFLQNTESYRRDNRRAEYGDERDPAMREFLVQISPLTHAAKIRKPLFVVHGRNDPRVPYSEAEQVVKAVREAGTPVWFLTAEDEGHSFVRADNRFYLSAATWAYYQRILSGRGLE